MKPVLLTSPALLAAAVLASACGDDNATTAANATPPNEPISLELQPDDPAPMREAKTLYKNVCSACHGPTGQGDGANAPRLDTRPRDHSSAEWQDAVSDAHLREVITGGGYAVGLSPLMPPQPQLADQPETLAALIKIVRSFRDA